MTLPLPRWANSLINQLMDWNIDSIILLSEECKVLNFNEKARQLFSNDLFVDMNMSGVFYKEDGLFKVDSITLEENYFHNAFKRNNKTHENLQNIQWAVEKISDKSNTYLILIGKNISSEKQLNDYRQSIIYLEAAIAHMPGHIFWKDSNSVYLGCNNRMSEICGLESPQDIVGKTDRELIWGVELAEEFVRDDQEVIRTGQPKSNIIERHHYANDKSQTMLTNKVPIKDTEGKIIGILGIATDITEQKQIESVLRQEKQKAEAASAAKSEFIANMAHDFRTPITGVTGMINAILYEIEGLKTEKLTSSLKDFIANSQRYAQLSLASADELLQLLNEILDVVRLESGLVKAKSEAFSRATRSRITNCFAYFILLHYKIRQNPLFRQRFPTRTCNVGNNIV